MGTVTSETPTVIDNAARQVIDAATGSGPPGFSLSRHSSEGWPAKAGVTANVNDT